MQHVLILTKNVLSEEQMIKRLHYLSYEVLCSSDLISALQQGKSVPIFSYFQVVMVSETLSNSELEQMLPTLNKYPVSVLRIGEEETTDDSRDWCREGIQGWVPKDAPIETLREVLIQAAQAAVESRLLNNQVVAFPMSEKEKVTSLVRSVYESFSKTEKRVFERLLLAHIKNQLVSRKELCDFLWEEGDTPSNMSQLSCLIHKIKRKFELAGISNEVVATLWGRGYRLNEEFCEQYLDEEEYLGLFQTQTASN